MSIRIAYQRAALSQDMSFGQTYQYAVNFPASEVAAEGAACRILFNGGTGGTPYANVYFGMKGAGVRDFAAPVVQVTVGGQPSFTVPAGADVWSDPLNLPIDEDGNYLCVFDALGAPGRNYRRQTGLAAGLVYHYKVGAGGSANGDVIRAASGWDTSAAGISAFIKAIEVADAVVDFEGVTPPPPPPPEDPGPISFMRSGLEAIRADKVYSRGARGIAGVDNQQWHFSLYCPAGESRVIVPIQIKIVPTEECWVELRSIEAPVPSGATGIGAVECNLNFAPGAPAGKARLYRHTSPTLLGALHGMDWIFPDRRNLINAIHDLPLSALYAGYIGFDLSLPAGVGVKMINVEWLEERTT